MVRYHGFDYVRCAACAGVVAIHTAVYESSDTVVSRVIGREVLMLAVPLFLLMSLYLFSNQGYPVRQRLVRYGWLYGFWVTIFTLGLGGIKLLGGEVEHFRIGGVLSYLLTGGHSPYYFLVSLAFLTGVSYLFRQAPTWVLKLALVGSVVVSATTWGWTAGRPTPYLVFVPFLPLAFVALLAARETVALRWVAGIAAISVVAAVIEWHWHVDAAYSRVSVVGFATVVFLLALRVTKEAPKPVVALADCTLGVYCLHLFFIAFFTGYVLVPVTFWQHLYEWFTVLAWSTLAVLGIKRALSYRMI